MKLDICNIIGTEVFLSNVKEKVKLHDPTVLFSLGVLIKCSLHILRVLSIYPYSGIRILIKKKSI